MAVERIAKCKMVAAKCKVRQTGSRGKGFLYLPRAKSPNHSKVGRLAHRFKRSQSQNERLDGTGPEALTYCIRVKLDALRLYAESRVMFKQRSQSIRNTDGG